MMGIGEVEVLVGWFGTGVDEMSAPKNAFAWAFPMNLGYLFH